MPRYRLILTRDVTESVVVEVEAGSKSLAWDQAHANVPETGWVVDDGNFLDRPYITDCEEI